MFYRKTLNEGNDFTAPYFPQTYEKRSSLINQIADINCEIKFAHNSGKFNNDTKTGLVLI